LRLSTTGLTIFACARTGGVWQQRACCGPRHRGLRAVELRAQHQLRHAAWPADPVQVRATHGTVSPPANMIGSQWVQTPRHGDPISTSVTCDEFGLPLLSTRHRVCRSLHIFRQLWTEASAIHGGRPTPLTKLRYIAARFRAGATCLPLDSQGLTNMIVNPALPAYCLLATSCARVCRSGIAESA
jgi:hypothetical protein